MTSSANQLMRVGVVATIVGIAFTATLCSGTTAPLTSTRSQVPITTTAPSPGRSSPSPFARWRAAGRTSGTTGAPQLQGVVDVVKRAATRFRQQECRGDCRDVAAERQQRHRPQSLCRQQQRHQQRSGECADLRDAGRQAVQAAAGGGRIRLGGQQL